MKLNEYESAFAHFLPLGNPHISLQSKLRPKLSI